MKTNFGTLAALTFALALAGCSAQSASDEAASSPAEAPRARAGQSTPSKGAVNVTPASAPRSDAPRRAVIRNGSLAVRVGNLETAERAAGSIIAQLGGYVDSADSSDLAGKSPTLTLTARIPEAAFGQALQQFESLGTRLSKRIGTQDVTAEIADHAARLATMRAHEESLRTILRQSADPSAMMEAQRRLAEARGEIEALQARLASVKGLAALSTVELRLEQSAETVTGNDPKWASESWAAASASAQGAFQALASFAMWAVAYSPLWALAYLAARAVRRRLARTSATASL